MELYQLRTFTVVAETGNLSRASDRLFTSQPAVSAHIKALEEEFGVRLFNRARRGMLLTKTGEKLLERARELLDGSRAILTEAERLRTRPTGKLRIGVNHPVGYLRADQVLRRLTTVFPELRVTLVLGTCIAVQEAVAEGALDAGFFDGPCVSSRLKSVQLTRHSLRVIAPREWAKDLDQPDWKVLQTKPWIFMSPSCSYFRLVSDLFRRKKLSLLVRFEVDDDRTLLDLVRHGVAMTVMPVAYTSDPLLCDCTWVYPHFQYLMPLSICCQKARAAEAPLKTLFETTRKVWLA